MELENKAHNVESAGDYLSAIEYYLLTLVTVNDNDFNENPALYAGRINEKVADLYTELSNLDSAIGYYKKAIENFLKSEEVLSKLYYNVAVSYTKIGACFLVRSKYKTALKYFNKAVEFGEKYINLGDYETILEVVQCVSFSLVFIIMCLINLGANREEILPYLLKAVALNETYEVKGFINDLSLFFLSIINEIPEETFRIFKEKILKTSDMPILSSILQTAVIGFIVEFGVNYIPSLKNVIIEKFLEGEGEVLLTQKVFEDMLLFGLSFANRKMDEHQYKEVLALLVGKIENNNVIISELVPMTFGSEMDVQFKDEHYVKASEINSTAAERNEFIVGWYHTHPSLGLFLSPVDIINQLGYQSLNEKAIAIVFDFTQWTPSRSGFAIFRLNEPSMAASYHAVQWRIIDAPKTDYIETISLLNRFLANLNHLLLKNQQISLSELTAQLDRSESLLEQIIPKLIELQFLPNTQYDPETKIISKKV